MKKIIFLVLFISFFTLCKAQYTDILDFKGTNSPQGLNPYGNLTLSVTGDTLFGMTAYGGAYSAGNIFCMSSGGYTDLYDFSGIDGLYPYGSLILSKDTLYGMTAYGGALGNGCIFAMTENASWFSDIYDFSGYSGGSSPYGSLLVRNDTLWGTTSTGGGTSSYGNVFCIETNGSGYYDVLDFNGSDGAFPYSSLTESHGYLWGTCSEGGNSGYGDIFVIDPHTLAYSDLFDFDGTNGAYCYGSLIPSVTGDSLFGMTSQGGGYGNVFAYVVGTGFENLFDFSSSNGANPNGDLTVSRGMLYGMTSLGGAYNDGILFSLGINSGLYTDLNDFNSFNGSYPYGSVTFSHNHTKFFGMTTQGNKINDGLIFSYNTLIIDSFRVTNVTCTNGYRGDVSAYVSGGATPYTYSWNPGGATTQSLSGLSAGSYTVTVTDNIGSMDTSVVVISDIILPVSELINVSCYGGDNGVIQVSPSGGTAPYVYSWKGPPPIATGTVTISMAPGPIERGLSAGTYTITVKDSCGDSAFVVATISQPALLIVSDSIVANVHCSGASTGSIATLVWGGTSPYIYQWSDASSQTTAIATGLSAGTYYVTVTDTNGCTAIDSATISKPSKPPVGVTIARAKNVSCSGSFDGMALALASGGVPPYTYYWTPGSDTTSIVTGLSAGIYTVQITDTRGCNAVASANISQPSVLLVSDTTIAALTLAYPSGGTPPYSYSWAPGGSTSSLTSGISAGTYTVTVTDYNGCADSAIINLKQALSAGLNLSLDYLGSTCADNPPWAGFFIYATSLPPTLFHNCVIDIQYSHSEFYPDSAEYGIQVLPENFLFYEYLNVIQKNDSVIEIQFGDSTESAAAAADENILNDSAQILLYIQLQIQNPCQSGYVSFTNILTTMSQSTYTDSALVGGSYVYSDSAYTTVYTNTIVTSPACGSTISISNIIPPINAGTNAQSIPENSSIFTINGAGFGGTIGAILVPDANTGSTNPSLLLDSMDILSWSNNQIVVRMPSYIFRDPASTPGSGSLQIFNVCGDTASTPLTINYNIEDTCTSSHSKLRKNISMVNDTVSLLFRCDTSISNHPQIQSVVLQAIETWNCYTGVNWKMGKDTTLENAALDGVSTIYFCDTLPNPMRTYPHIDTICNNVGDSMAFVYDADILIRPTPGTGYIWNYNTSDSLVSGNPHHYYFFDALMHELGHAQLLNHINDPTSLMWCKLDSNVRRTILGGTYPGPQTLYGAFDVVSTDSAFTNTCKDSTLKNIPRGCIDPTLDVPSIANNSFNLNLYPNPANSNITLAYTLSNNTHVQFMVTDCIGRVIMKLPEKDSPPGNYKVQVNTSDLAQGVYLVIANFNGEVETIKFIKV